MTDSRDISSFDGSLTETLVMSSINHWRMRCLRPIIRNV